MQLLPVVGPIHATPSKGGIDAALLLHVLLIRLAVVPLLLLFHVALVLELL